MSSKRKTQFPSLVEPWGPSYPTSHSPPVTTGRPEEIEMAQKNARVHPVLHNPMLPSMRSPTSFAPGSGPFFPSTPLTRPATGSAMGWPMTTIASHRVSALLVQYGIQYRDRLESSGAAPEIDPSHLVGCGDSFSFACELAASLEKTQEPSISQFKLEPQEASPGDVIVVVTVRDLRIGTRIYARFMQSDTDPRFSRPSSCFHVYDNHYLVRVPDLPSSTGKPVIGPVQCILLEAETNKPLCPPLSINYRLRRPVSSDRPPSSFPLHIATNKSSVQGVISLLEQGVSPNDRDARGIQPIGLALWNGNKILFSLLYWVSVGVKPTVVVELLKFKVLASSGLIPEAEFRGSPRAVKPEPPSLDSLPSSSSMEPSRPFSPKESSPEPASPEDSEDDPFDEEMKDAAVTLSRSSSPLSSPDKSPTTSTRGGLESLISAIEAVDADGSAVVSTSPVKQQVFATPSPMSAISSKEGYKVIVSFRHGRPRQELRYFAEKVRCWQGYDICIEVRRPDNGELCSDISFENNFKIKINLLVNEDHLAEKRAIEAGAEQPISSGKKEDELVTRMTEKAREQFVKYKQKGVEGVLQEPFFFPFSRTRRCRLVKGRADFTLRFWEKTSMMQTFQIRVEIVPLGIKGYSLPFRCLHKRTESRK